MHQKYGIPSNDLSNRRSDPGLLFILKFIPIKGQHNLDDMNGLLLGLDANITCYHDGGAAGCR